MFILFGVSIKEGGSKGIPFYGRFQHSITGIMMCHKVENG